MPTPESCQVEVKTHPRLLLTRVHVGHGEVHCGLPDGRDAHVDDGQVRHLRPQLPDHPGPLTILQAAVGSVRLHVKLKLELKIFCKSLKAM